MKKIDKRVLFVNQKVELDDDTKLILKVLRRYVKSIELITNDTQTNIITYFKRVGQDIDVLIFDHHVKDGIDLLNSILEIKPKQRTIILSGSSYCSDLYGCEHCQNRYYKKRLLKPFSKKALFECIEFFDKKACSYKHECEVLREKNFMTSILRW